MWSHFGGSVTFAVVGLGLVAVVCRGTGLCFDDDVREKESWDQTTPWIWEVAVHIRLVGVGSFRKRNTARGT